ncbi:MAG: MarR family winged helix-turn-helix transcriptional regulator [Acidimicrobiales bacterium]
MVIQVSLTDTPLPPDAPEREQLAASAWVQIANLFLSHQHRREEVAGDLGLHISDLISLFHLQPGEGVTQRALAEHWSCDASWVTNRIDRLEELGLVERRVSPADRRVKEVWLTDPGLVTRRAGMDGFTQPPRGARRAEHGRPALARPGPRQARCPTPPGWNPNHRR